MTVRPPTNAHRQLSPRNTSPVASSTGAAFHRFALLLLAFGLLLSLAAPDPVRAQGGYAADKPIGASAQQLPGYLAHAGVQQHLGQSLPLDSTYTDEAGHTAPLRTWLTGKPVALALVYYRCAMLCPQVLHGLAAGLKESALIPGKDFSVLVFSIDPEDTPRDAAVQKAMFLQDLGLSSPTALSNVHFLTGTQPAIDAVASATGFGYVRVPGPDGKMTQFAHSSVVMFATPKGQLSKYLSGVNYPGRDLRLALLGASAHKISNPVDLLILYCCNYNPVVGRYSVSVMRVLSIAGMLAVLGLITLLVLLTRKPLPQAA